MQELWLLEGKNSSERALGSPGYLYREYKSKSGMRSPIDYRGMDLDRCYKSKKV